MTYSENENKVCDICGMIEPDFWWLDEWINSEIRKELMVSRQIFVRIHYPSFDAAVAAWENVERQPSVRDLQNSIQ